MTNTRTIRTLQLLGSAACMLLVVPLMAQDPAPVAQSTGEFTQQMPSSTIDFVRQRLESIEQTALAAVKPLPEGESKNLLAIVMHTHGKVQWRSDADGAWQAAQTDDTLPEGAMIRTGLKSSLTLRVGLNATVLIDSNARVTIPRIVHDGQQLETAVKVARGRADIQVNHVGLTNDFSVITPSGALAVKGTGFACRYDEFNGTSIVGSRKNTINAIEVHYYATKLAYYLSGGAISSNKNENPTLAALIEAAPPPSANKAEQQDAADQETSPGGAVTNTDAVTQTVRIDLAIQADIQAEAANNAYADDLPSGDVLLLPGFESFNAIPAQFMGEVAAAMYFDITGTYDGDSLHFGLQHIPASFAENLMQRLNYSGSVNPLIESVTAYGEYIDTNFDDYVASATDLRAILMIVDEFCQTRYPGNAVKIQICRQCFTDAVTTTFSGSQGEAYYEYLVGGVNGEPAFEVP
jgi:hypothetical protein